ncbi:fimbria/pilus outer membrane usher protein [Salmonella enterica subsp. enterica]|nr:fimbria/pilus outer membrane usher protein [Salmonella enterica subsp. enterica]
MEQNAICCFIERGSSGPSIADLATAGGGASDVTVREADGCSINTGWCLTLPYRTCQPRVSKYDFSAGRSHIEGADNQADFTNQLSVWPNNLLTLYGGTMCHRTIIMRLPSARWNTRIGHFA